MADFKTSYNITSANEGGYANVAGDKGGETYKGIARNYHPTWSGWKIIDSIKAKNPGITRKDLDALLANDSTLQGLVLSFFKTEFWDVAKLDNISNQNIANEVYDTGVNFGMSKSIKFLQEACNFTRSDMELEVDGIVGTNTLKAVTTHPYPDVLFKALNIRQGEAYFDAWRKDPTQEKFVRGWLTRVTFL